MRRHIQILSIENNDNIEKKFEKLIKFEQHFNFFKKSKKIYFEIYDYLDKFFSI